MEDEERSTAKEKVCASCKLSLGFCYFRVNRKNPAGRDGVCRVCCKRSQDERVCPHRGSLPLRVIPTGGLLLAGYAREGEHDAKPP